jgi:hypothetical protein
VSIGSLLRDGGHTDDIHIVKYPNVIAIVLPYTVGVAYSDVGLTNLIPQTFMPLYGFDAAQQGMHT